MGTKMVSAEFFAQGYRVSGSYVATLRALADDVYDPNTNYVELRDAYVSPIMSPARISAHYKHAIFDKDNLDFILTVDPHDGLRRDQRYGLGRYAFDTFLTVPFFEIHGELRLTTQKFDTRLFLSSEAGSFITLLNVVAHSTFNPAVSYEAGVALVSRTKVSFFGQKVNA